MSGTPTGNSSSASTVITDNSRRQGNGDLTGRRRKPENDGATPVAPPPYDHSLRVTRSREIEHEPGARLSKNNPRASASSNGAQDEAPFIPPEPMEDLLGEQRGLQRAREGVESSSDGEYDIMDVDPLTDSDLDDTPTSGKGKGVEPSTHGASYSRVGVEAPRAQSSASAAAHRQPQGPSHGTQWERWTPQPTFENQNYHPTLHWKPSKCVVCKTKAPYEKHGKSYPTCGLTCAAKLEEQEKREAWGSGRRYSDLCEVCKRRPKLSTGTGRYYDQCSSCRDKGKAPSANAAVVTCTSCLVCWVKPLAAQAADKPYCSDDCKRAMQSNGPALIETPRGHISFDKYHKLFQTGWDPTSQRKAVVQHMYFFAQAPQVISRYAGYKAKLEDMIRARSSETTEGWVAITRECNVGDSGSVQMCHSANCKFCNIMVNSFAPHDYPQGISVVFNAAKASEGLRDAGRGSNTALLFVKVVHGPRSQLQESTSARLWGSQRNREAVVAVLPYSGSRNQSELRVYNPDAILPLGLLVYSKK
ncbi:hypothetical protein MD484_g7313, partial [Candolleomyces efflorescens]